MARRCCPTFGVPNQAWSWPLAPQQLGCSASSDQSKPRERPGFSLRTVRCVSPSIPPMPAASADETAMPGVKRSPIYDKPGRNRKVLGADSTLKPFENMMSA